MKIQYSIPADKEYDCVMLGFQPWFLHVSIPFNSFMQTEDFARVVKNKPVVLIADSRNTWRNAVDEVMLETKRNGGDVRGIFAYRDVNKNRQGFLQSYRWVSSGKKKSFSIGVHQKVIDAADINGAQALAAVRENDGVYYKVIPDIFNDAYTSIEYEQHIIKRYKKWAKFISKNNFKNRKNRMFLFTIYMCFVFFVLTPFIARKGR